MEDIENKKEKQDDDSLYYSIEDNEEEFSDTDEDGYQDKYDRLDKSGPNYSQAETNGDSNGMPQKENSSPLSLLLKILFNPIEGWKSVRRSGLTVEDAQKQCFYPLISLLAISKFAGFFYNSRVALSDLLVQAVIAFVSFFFGYFCIVLLLKAIMPEATKKTMASEFTKVFVIMSLSSLCLFFTTLDIFPMLWAILIFLPLWTVYAICRGARFFRFPENKSTLCTCILCILIIGMPCLLDWILNRILPQ